jgi:hypothetical protein
LEVVLTGLILTRDPVFVGIVLVVTGVIGVPIGATETTLIVLVSTVTCEPAGQVPTTPSIVPGSLNM